MRCASQRLLAAAVRSSRHERRRRFRQNVRGRAAEQRTPLFRSAEAMFDGVLDEDVNGSGVAKADLRLGRMDVYVDALRIELHEQGDSRKAVGIEGFCCPIGRVGQNTVLDQPAVDEEELIAPAA